MMTEQHVAVRRYIIEAVIVPIGWCLPSGIDAQHPVGDE
jgi:hypothetical protein